MTDKTVVQIIEDYEMSRNGWYRLSGRSVEVLKVTKIKDGYQADVVLHNDEDGVHETYDSCFYPNKLFKVDKK